MRTLPILVALSLFALAGCSESPDMVIVPDEPEPSDNSTAPSNETPPPEPAPVNHPPTANLTADLTNGTAPLNVTFTLEGSDPDGDALDWTLSINGTTVANGTDLPVDVGHSFTEAGNVSVVLMVSDGNATANATLDLAVEASSVEPVTLTGEVLVPDPWAMELDGCLLDAGRRDAGGPGGVTGQDHDIDPAWWGYSFAFDVEGVIAEFWSDEPDILGASATGIVPEDAVSVVVCINDPDAADVEYVLTLS